VSNSPSSELALGSMGRTIDVLGLTKGFRDHMEEKFDLKGYQVALTADYGYNDKSTKIEVSVKEDDEIAEKVREAIDDLHKTTI
jgi:hypothetical protein